MEKKEARLLIIVGTGLLLLNTVIVWNSGATTGVVLTMISNLLMIFLGFMIQKKMKDEN